MNNLNRISQALNYIDNNLNEDLDYKHIADVFHFSSFYFHRIFSAIVGKTITAHIRDRRLIKACQLLANSDELITSICVDCGFDSSQAFSRTFKNCYGISPTNYRKLGYVPAVLSVEEIIIKFTNRLKGGILVYPNIIKKQSLLIAGITGDGSKTGELWQCFMEANKKIGLNNKLSDNGYEIRIYTESECKCHVGVSVSDSNVNSAFTLFQLPASEYASFDVYVAKGYESENSAMDEWLEVNKERYVQKLYDGKPYAVEFYDERFNGNNTDSIVEIWIPIEKNKS